MPRWLLIPALIIMSLYWTQDYWQKSSEPTLFDIPKTLEEKEFTLEVYPVSNVNNVMIFSTGISGNEEDYLYLTPASEIVEFPIDYAEKKDSGYILRVHGKFYSGTGIPVEYLYTKPKPVRYRVFRFDHAKMIAAKEKI